MSDPRPTAPIETEQAFREKLSPEEYRVLREAGTEAPFSGEYVDTREPGEYRCRACRAVLFLSSAKFDSGSGWPSFTAAAADTVGTRADESHGMSRTEIFCKNCGSHLGHLFDDGPRDRGGKRYCVNSLSLDFIKEGPAA